MDRPYQHSVDSTPESGTCQLSSTTAPREGSGTASDKAYLPTRERQFQVGSKQRREVGLVQLGTAGLANQWQPLRKRPKLVTCPALVPEIWGRPGCEASTRDPWHPLHLKLADHAQHPRRARCSTSHDPSSRAFWPPFLLHPVSNMRFRLRAQDATRLSRNSKPDPGIAPAPPAPKDRSS